MPRSLLLSALLFIAFGSACILWKYALGFAMPIPLWVAPSAILGGLGLLRGQNSGRIFASLVIAFAFISVILDLIASPLAPRQGTSEIWLFYGRGFLVIAILILVSKVLWSRSVSIYLTRIDDTKRTKNT